jgi:hypothetical protein
MWIFESTKYYRPKTWAGNLNFLVLFLLVKMPLKYTYHFLPLKCKRKCVIKRQNRLVMTDNFNKNIVIRLLRTLFQNKYARKHDGVWIKEQGNISFGNWVIKRPESVMIKYCIEIHLHSSSVLSTLLISSERDNHGIRFIFRFFGFT